MKTKKPEDIVLSKIEEERIILWNTQGSEKYGSFNVIKNEIHAPLDVANSDRVYILFHELRHHYQWKNITMIMFLLNILMRNVFNWKYHLFCLFIGLILKIDYILLISLPLSLRWFIELDANIYASKNQMNLKMFWLSQWSYTKLPLSLISIGYIVEVLIKNIFD